MELSAMYEKPNKFQAVLFSGILIGLISGIPFIRFLNCCCAGILVGGAVSVYLYRREFTEEMPPMESSDALIVGIISGIIGALLTTMLSVH
jgi:ammonia channel protein AmtB